VTGAESFLQYAYICILKPYFSSVIGPVVYVLDLADRLISKACPFAAAGIMVGSIYWTAVTYGAVTVMQVHVYFLFYILQALRARLLNRAFKLKRLLSSLSLKCGFATFVAFNAVSTYIQGGLIESFLLLSNHTV